MPLPTSGAITLDQIQTEFDGNNPISLGEYYRGTGNVTNNNTNVPLTGPISIGNFYGSSVSTVTYVGGFAVAYGGGGTTKTITINALTGGIASAPSVGDLVILAWNVSTTVNVTFGAPAGWTLAHETYNPSQTGRIQDTNLMVAYRTWAAGDSTVTFNVSTSDNNAAAAIIKVFRNVRGIIGSNVSLATNNASATISPPVINTFQLNAVVVVIVAFGNNDNSTLTAPGNLLDVRTANGNDYRDARISMGHTAAITTGGLSQYTPSNWTMATATDRAPVSVTIRLQPD